MSRVVASALLVLLVLPAAAPLASAHCDPGTEGKFFNLVSTCALTGGPLEDAVDAFNAQNAGRFVVVLVKDFRFHPEVATLHSGATVVFLYADTDQNQQHDPVTSGPCAAPTDLLASPKRCEPTQPGLCFNILRETGALLNTYGQTYPVTLKASGLDIQESRGFFSGSALGDATGAQPFRACPVGTAVAQGGAAVIAYHCGLHGGAFTARRDMRAALVVLP